MKKSSLFTIITGASSGLGKCFAEECAKKRRNLILASLPNESIDEVASELAEKYNVTALGYEIDLTINDEILAFTQWIKDNYAINMLINNAGIGGTNNFLDWSFNYIDTLIQLNVKAPVLLTHELLPLLKEQPTSNIINVSSIAGMIPMPYKTIYPASKMFLSSFSNAINEELKGTGVSVCAVYPGGMPTNPEMLERLDGYTGYMKRSFMSPEDSARIFLEKALKGETRVVAGLTNKISRWIIKFLPLSFQLSVYRRRFKKEIEERSCKKLRFQ